MRRLKIAFGLQRAIRALVIWRAVLTLLAVSYTHLTLPTKA